LIAVPTTVVVVEGFVVVVVDGVVVVVVLGGVVEVVAGLVVVVARAGVVVVVVVVAEVLVVPTPASDDPPFAGALDARVVVVAPRELSDKVAGLLWKLISAANPATVAAAAIPARFIVDSSGLCACGFSSSRPKTQTLLRESDRRASRDSVPPTSRRG
jgi:hypothetical protein